MTCQAFVVKFGHLNLSYMVKFLSVNSVTSDVWNPPPFNCVCTTRVGSVTSREYCKMLCFLWQGIYNAGALRPHTAPRDPTMRVNKPDLSHPWHHVWICIVQTGRKTKLGQAWLQPHLFKDCVWRFTNPVTPQWCNNCTILRPKKLVCF